MIEPKIPKKDIAAVRTCARCHKTSTTEDFTKTRSPFCDGYLPICNECINEYLEKFEYEWDAIDRLCRWADLPFIVKEWTRLTELNTKKDTWKAYSNIFSDSCYEGFGWSDYNRAYEKLREAGQIEEEIPLLDKARISELHKKWGANYDTDELYYLEELYKGLLLSQNVNGALQIDQAQKICKLSLEIDSRIRSGDKEVDKFLSSYDKLVKTAEFTPKNTKNAIDFDSFAEVGYWLEKRGRQNKFFDDTTRDVIDSLLKNIENYNQRLYTNEGGIGDEITERLHALKMANAVEENVYDLPEEVDLDAYENDGFNVVDEDFDIEVDD